MVKVALVHDWLTGMRGGEYVFEAIAELFPKAELFTLLRIPSKISPALTAIPFHTSWLQSVPGIERNYRYFLPLMSSAIESFDLRGFHLVISSSHCVAKGIQKPPGAVHVSYVHAPMRYMWDRFDDYFGPSQGSAMTRMAARNLRPKLQNWDRETSSPERVNTIVANSRFIAEQIRRAYGRESQVVYPFADFNRFIYPRNPGQKYLIVTAFAPYKRIDLAIQAFNELKLPLIIVGSGQDEKKLKRIAGPTVEFLGSLLNEAVAELYSTCKAFVFPGVEDFGITPLEAMASGAPVIAFNQGGAAETVTEKTGIFFSSQEKESLIDAIEKFESGRVRINEADCRKRALEFSRERFQREFRQVVMDSWTAAKKDPKPLESSMKNF